MTIASLLTDVPHPGEFIAEELEARGWLQRDLAYILGVPEQAVNMIVSGKRGISAEMAKALADAFDVSPEFFANMQSAYEMSKARQPDPGIAKRALFQSRYPIREMIKRQWLVDSDVPMLEAQLMRFFRTNDLASIAQFKKKDYEDVSPVQLAWFSRVYQVASEMVVPSYSEKQLKALIQRLPQQMMDPEEVRHVPRLLSECGIRYVIVETLPKANIDGVCFWQGKQPVVAMTTRFDRIDNYWFVLRHELAHLLAGDGRTDAVPRIDVDIQTDEKGDAELPAAERAANQEAAAFCVPRAELDSFYARKAPFISERDVLGFAQRIGRHPGIVVGQLQRKMGRHDFLARLKVKIRHFLLPAAVSDGWGNPAPVAL
jgi:HTH-type transcriptional regulator/antitoxin HigA